MRNKKVGSDFLEKSRHGHDQAKTVLAGHLHNIEGEEPSTNPQKRRGRELMGFPLSSCPKPVKLIYLFSFCLLFYFDISTPYIICIICFCLFCFMSSAPLQ